MFIILISNYIYTVKGIKNTDYKQVTHKSLDRSAGIEYFLIYSICGKCHHLYPIKVDLKYPGCFLLNTIAFSFLIPSKNFFFLTFTLCYTLDPWNFKNLSPYVTLWNPRGMYLTEPGTSFVTYYKLFTFLSVDMEILAPWSAAEGCTGYCRVLKSPYLRIGT